MSAFTWIQMNLKCTNHCKMLVTLCDVVDTNAAWEFGYRNNIHT